MRIPEPNRDELIKKCQIVIGKDPWKLSPRETDKFSNKELRAKVKACADAVAKATIAEKNWLCPIAKENSLAIHGTVGDITTGIFTRKVEDECVKFPLIKEYPYKDKFVARVVVNKQPDDNGNVGYYEVLSPDKKKSYGKHACINVGFKLSAGDAAKFSEKVDKELDEIASPLERIDLIHKLFQSSESVKGKMAEWFPRRTSFWAFNSSMENYIDSDFDPEAIGDPMLTNQLYSLIRHAAPGIVSGNFVKRIEESMRVSPEVTKMWVGSKGGINEYFNRFPSTLRDLDHNQRKYLKELLGVDVYNDEIVAHMREAIEGIPDDFIDLLNEEKKIYFHNEAYEGVENTIPFKLTPIDIINLAKNFYSYDNYTTDFKDLVDELYNEGVKDDADDDTVTLDEDYGPKAFMRDHSDVKLSQDIIDKYESRKEDEAIQINIKEMLKKEPKQRTLDGKYIYDIHLRDTFVYQTDKEDIARSYWERIRDREPDVQRPLWYESLKAYLKENYPKSFKDKK